MYSLGIDIGYSSIKIALVKGNNDVVFQKYQMHKGDVRLSLKSILEEVLQHYDSGDISYGAVTGSGIRFLTRNGAVEPVNEIAAIVEGSLALNGNIRSIIDIGGQSAKYITDFSGDSRSRIKMSMNTSCSAGTGSFLEEQVSRLNLTLDDYSTYIKQARSIPRIAGRCSVFAKTDIIHHQQEGVSVEDILLGLAYAVVRNYKGTVMRKLPLNKPFFFIGGVAHNQGIVNALIDILKLDPEELIIHEHFSTAGAIGTAITAFREQRYIHLEKLRALLDQKIDADNEHSDGDKIPSLASFIKSTDYERGAAVPMNNHQDLASCRLGIDVGSTSTNLVLINQDNDIVAYRYLRTLGDPIKAVEKGFGELHSQFGGNLKIDGVGVTGSGRYLIGKLVGADVIKDEISAQAKAAAYLDPKVDTIFEIGGQDSKYISINKGIVTDFQMNKICAAGTGSFLEEQANKFDIPIDHFGEIALAGANPVNLGERCTVFIETSIAAHLAKGTEISDIAAGLCRSVAKNYLTRVVGNKPVGEKVYFQGGVAHNPGVVNAFRMLIGDKVTVPPYFSVTGAFGAALMAREEMESRLSRFKGFEFNLKDQFLTDKKEKTPNPDHKRLFGKQIESIIFEGYDGTIDPTKKTVGIPRALFTYGMFPLFSTFFKELGFNVLLSDPSSEYTVGLGQDYALDETCYPVKLVNGHVAELVQKKVDYIFFPDLYTVDHPGSESRQNYGCAYMQLAFKVANRAMELEKAGIELLAPTIAFSLGKEFMMKSFAGLGEQLGKTEKQTKSALEKGMKSILDFEERMEKNALETMNSLEKDEKAFVLVSKIYGVADPVLNMGIPEKLMESGYKVIPFFQLPEVDMSREHPNMFWPFGQHILEPARLIKNHPNLYAVLLTHHGCGPDSVFAHYFREIMDGKPYLYVEVDEHSSSVGVVTRVEAFINSLEEHETRIAGNIEDYTETIRHKDVNIKENLNHLSSNAIVHLPYLFPYSDIFREMLIRNGINASIFHRTTKASSDMGRKFTVTEEYFSLTALLGDVFSALSDKVTIENDPVLLLPQTEGAEVEGQYARLLRTKLDEEGFGWVNITSPFVEDFPGLDEKIIDLVFKGLIAGDLVLMAPRNKRKTYLLNILQEIFSDRLSISFLNQTAGDIFNELKMESYNKRILAVGEIFVLYNDFLNDFTFYQLERQGNRVAYAPLSEYLWMIWQDYADQNPTKVSSDYQKRLDKLKGYMNTVSDRLADESHFEAISDRLITTANETIGYYAGAGGRYREAKLLRPASYFDGIINVFSMYENTGITLSMLHKGFEKNGGKPFLNLTFDGNKNENDVTRIESFIHYL